MEVFLVYLWLKLDTLSGFFGITSLIVGSFLTICSIFFFVDETVGRKENPEYLKWKNLSLDQRTKLDCPPPTIKKKWREVFGVVPITIVISFGALWLFLPSANQAAVLVGTHYAVKLAESPEGLKVQSLIRKKANEFLDEQLKEVTK